LKRWLIFLVVLTFWTCAPEQNDKVKSTTSFYDINGLIDEQTKLLGSVSPSVLKKAIIDGKEEIIEFTQLDSAGWSKELNIFKSMDINKSILIDSYITTESSDETSKTIAYKSKYPRTTHVDELSIQLNKKDEKPVKIHAKLDKRNELFNSSKILEMYFKNINGKLLVAGYKTEGWQKMISKDSTSFSIEAEIIYP